MTVQLTKVQWRTKIEALAPRLIWEQDVVIGAWASALAACSEALQIKLAEHISDTFILTATAGTLDTHGGERSITRTLAEVDADYAVRIQNLLNKSSPTALKALVDGVLLAGTSIFQEDFYSFPFCDRGDYCDRAALFLAVPITNGFSIIVEIQPSLDVFTAIRDIVDANKAVGTLYRIYELPT